MVGYFKFLVINFQQWELVLVRSRISSYHSCSRIRKYATCNIHWYI
jgi:hypothetical protein